MCCPILECAYATSGLAVRLSQPMLPRIDKGNLDLAVKLGFFEACLWSSLEDGHQYT